MIQTVLVTGGAGYVGSVLVPRLLGEGYRVKVLDLYLYGKKVLNHVRGHQCLEEVEGDVRDQALLRHILPGCDAVIHLACISNDPSFDLQPELGKSINEDAFEPLVRIARDHGVERFILASSSSVYGVKEGSDITEETLLDPVTGYSRSKVFCEEALRRFETPNFATVAVRSATVCGASPRQRLDTVVNILTNIAVHTSAITIWGGEQKRPNIHMQDIVDLYSLLLSIPAERITGKAFNAGYANHSVSELAAIVKNIVGPQVTITTLPSDDHRSYHISSKKITSELGWCPKRTIEDAVSDLVRAFEEKKFPNSLTDSRYFNVKRMAEVHLPIPALVA